MEEQQQSTFQLAVMPGILLAIALILFGLVMFLLDVAYDSKIMYVSYLIMIAGLYWAMTNIRDKGFDGYISYGKSFSSGFYIMLIASVIAAIYTYFYVTMINPGMIEDILLNAEEKMLEANPNMSDEEIEMAISMTEKFTSPVMMAVWGFIGNIVSGTIFSLIIAIFVKRENNNPA